MSRRHKISNRNHPELKKGEVYLCSLFRESDFLSLPYKTKRKGEKAFDFMGKPLLDCFPVFANRKEVVKVDRKRKPKLERWFSKSKYLTIFHE